MLAPAAAGKHIGSHIVRATQLFSVAVCCSSLLAANMQATKFWKSRIQAMPSFWHSPRVARILLLASIGDSADEATIAIREEWSIEPGPRGVAWKCKATGKTFACALAELRTALVWAGTDIRTVCYPCRAMSA